MLASTACVAVLAVLSERLVCRPLRHASGPHPMIAAIGVLLFFEASEQAIWGADFRRMQSPYNGIIHVLGLTATVHGLLLIGSAFALVAALDLFLTRTTMGWTILVMAENREGASLVSIDPAWFRS
ncbi:hypothetical protein [Caballeronia sp. SEWSISQ10-4 2]|uniref:ABC transporter permease subunit n=1 Tax=Caballeronia sp. SEWSISQ10-4 2 TaxID=2937438 RepID=UPI0034636708